MIRTNKNKTLLQCRKQLLQFLKQKGWVHYIYIINNIIENRTHNMPNGNVSTFDQNINEPLYGIDFLTYSYGTHHNTELLKTWITGWVTYIKQEHITYDDSLKKPY